MVADWGDACAGVARCPATDRRRYSGGWTLGTRRRRQRQERVTLLDVATAAGVSSITVSRALRNPEKVSPALRETIMKFVESMGYVPDFAARALASQNSGIIGVLSPALTNYSFIGIMRGIEDRVRSTDMRIQYANTHFDPADEIKQLRLFFAQNPSGIIIAGVEEHPDVLDLLHRAPCPVVQIMDINGEPVDMSIGINHRLAAEMATAHLIERGFRRIALMGGRWDIRSRRRFDGYRAVMEKAGLYDPELVFSLDAHTSVGLGGHLLERLLRQAPDADAAFCHNDDIALGVLFECQRRGIRLPADFGICGFNDLEYANVSTPSLTTVRVPRYEIGYRAVDMIVRASGNGTQPEAQIDLGFHLVERETTARY